MPKGKQLHSQETAAVTNICPLVSAATPKAKKAWRLAHVIECEAKEPEF
jgi:hypothetical protein